MSYDVKNFEREVIERSYEIPVLVDFWASWCGPCRVLGPVLEKLAGQNTEKWVLAKLNTEEHVDVAQRFQIQSIPNVKLFVDGAVADEFVGALPEHLVQRWLQNAIPSRHRKQILGAQELLRTGKTSEAKPLLEQILNAEPENSEARSLLAQAILFSEPERASALVENVEDPRLLEINDAIRVVARLRQFLESPNALPASPVQRQYQEAIRELFAQNFDVALQAFIEVIRSERYYDNDGSRKACIAIFKILGEEHEMTLKYRREFSSALYV